MTISSTQVAVSGTVPQTLAFCPTGDRSGIEYFVANRGAGTVFVGGPAVSGTTGYRLIPAQTHSGHLNGGEALAGIATSGTVTVDVLTASGNV